MDHTYTSAVILLLLILDPMGNVPVFLSLVKDIPRERHLRIVLRECAIAAGVLLLFLFVGQQLLRAMHLTSSALELAGGVILFVIALRMVFPQQGLGWGEGLGREPFIVPLASPMIAGPSAMASVILLASRQPEAVGLWAGAILSAMLVVTVVLSASAMLARLLGQAGVLALERLMGLLLSAMAVQMMVNGLKTALAS